MHTRCLNIFIKFKVKIVKMAMLVYGLIVQWNEKSRDRLEYITQLEYDRHNIPDNLVNPCYFLKHLYNLENCL